LAGVDVSGNFFAGFSCGNRRRIFRGKRGMKNPLQAENFFDYI
jgi:hypothetical protein